MHITRQADYAIRIVLCLSQVRDKLEMKAIAEETAVTPQFTFKILRTLVQKKIVKSLRGVHGGYSLACDPEELTLLDIIEAIDGPIVLSPCVQDDNICTRMGREKSKCPVHHFFTDLNTEVHNRLKSRTIESLA